MPFTYRVIEIFTSEEARFKSKPLHMAIVERVKEARIAARCIVSKAVAGCYESGEVATHGLEILSFNMPLKIEIILPATELDNILPAIEEMVSDGIVVVEEMDVRVHRTKHRLLPRQLRVRDVMTQAPRSVLPATPVGEVVRLLLSSNFNGVPVIDAQQTPVGIITQEDLIKRARMPVRLGLLADLDPDKVESLLGALSPKTAGEIMSQPAVTVSEDEVLTKAVDLMLARRLKRLPVVNAEGKLVGVLSRLDVFRTIALKTPDWSAIQEHAIDIQNARTVRDIMRRDTHVVAPETPALEVIKIIDTNDIQRVAVVDRDGRLLGLISDRRLLAAFSEHHGGLWDYLISKLSFTEIGRRHKAFLESVQSKTAAEVMQPGLTTVHEDTALDEAVRIMVDKQLKRLPVIDAQGLFKGMVSRDSLLRAGTGGK